MGTLTANTIRLPEFCEHKLPTSCRLTSIPNCCACADERAHAASYSTYIDGIGFVPRGNRWQRYCWFCKEFWEHRVKVSGLRPAQTRIPEVPDQTAFLEKWYEFHRGYRIVQREDGSEERVAVLGEDFRDVSPGYLPRTLEEMREGRRRAEEVQQVQQQDVQAAEQNGPSLEDTLEQMFEEASLEETEAAGSSATRSGDTNRNSSNQQRDQYVEQYRQDLQAGTQRAEMRSNNIHEQAMSPAASRNPDYQLRRVAALRRELNRMRHGIERVVSGLRDLGEDIPGGTELASTESLTALGATLNSISGPDSGERAEQATSSINASIPPAGAQTQSDRTLAGMQSRVEEARAQVDDARQARDQAASEFDLAETEFRGAQQRLQQLQREERTAENYMRLFGTREEMLAQGEAWESPIGGMFTRAEERFRVAEESRVEERTLREVLAGEAAGGGEQEAGQLAELEARERDVWGVPQRRRDDDGTLPPHLAPTLDEEALQQYYAMIRAQDRQEPPEGLGDGIAVTMEEAAAAGAPTENFPQSMLNAVRAVRQAGIADAEISPLLNEGDDAQEVTEPLEPLPNDGISWYGSALHILNGLAADGELCSEVGMTLQESSRLLTHFTSNEVSSADHNIVHALVESPLVIWRTGLPAEWLRLLKANRGHEATTTAGLLYRTDETGYPTPDVVQYYNNYLLQEIVAQAYQMSGQLRRRAQDLSAPERLQILYRLQAGRRTTEDMAVIRSMRENPDTMQLASTVYATTLPSNAQYIGNEERTTQQHSLDSQRRAMANDGNYSRSELDSRRRETAQAFALAAGRQAMQTGSEALIAQQAVRNATEINEGSRAALRRLQANNFMGRPPRIYRQLTLSDYLHEDDVEESGSDSDSENEGRGLDAEDTGRPDPKPEEELQVQMECKICYTQLAEVACLPCGHLVMCRWCSDQHSPCLQHDRTRPRRAANCPVCRKGIRQKVKVFRA
ncbi:hypothetical protein LTR09_000296 [Extremus antarcticus]|uniref:RING-type domain-containing protein n=1 Tax=Extremus antarcticus TaxID=702011 RepID=A0AAJ0GJC6_9PEZI|nr:hypothetical protein LTR09_000296 [Extremus antarcticus]